MSHQDIQPSKGLNYLNPSHIVNRYKMSSFKNIINNLFHLSILQGVNYLFPLITLPYLFRVLGVEQIGIIALAQAVIQYFIIITDYGFDLAATRDISVNKTNSENISRIFSSVISTKLLLLIISAILLFVLVQIIPSMSIHKHVYYITFGMVIGQVLFPIYLFQGLEKMNIITYINSSVKIAALIVILLLIRKPEHITIYLIINSSIQILIGIIGFIVAIKKFKIQFYISTWFEIITNLKQGVNIFLSNLSVSIYISSNIIILGMFASPVIVGYYALVEKPILAIRGFAVIIFKSIYPSACSYALESFEKLVSFFKRTMIPLAIVLFSACTIMFIFSTQIIFLLSGEKIQMAINLLRILSFVPLIVFINIPANQSLLAYKFEKEYLKILFLGAILSIALNLLLCSIWEAYGTALAVVLAEIFVTGGLYLTLKSKVQNIKSK